MGMGMKSLKWEGIGTKNLFPHTSSAGYARTYGRTSDWAYYLTVYTLLLKDIF